AAARAADGIPGASRAGLLTEAAPHARGLRGADRRAERLRHGRPDSPRRVSRALRRRSPLPVRDKRCSVWPRAPLIPVAGGETLQRLFETVSWGHGYPTCYHLFWSLWPFQQAPS